MVSLILFSSTTDEWETPQWLFDELNVEFNFSWDLCANTMNTKVKNGFYFTKESDALCRNWFEFGSISRPWLWCNPPYSKSKEFIKKAYEESLKGAKIVMLLPSRTDTKAFHNYIYKKPNVEIRFIKGRLKFGSSKNSAPFPSMIVIFNGQRE